MTMQARVKSIPTTTGSPLPSTHRRRMPFPTRDPRGESMTIREILSTTDADKLRTLEDKVNAWAEEFELSDDYPLLCTVRQLISEQIMGLEVGTNYRVIGPNNRIFWVTKEE